MVSVKRIENIEEIYNLGSQCTFSCNKYEKANVFLAYVKQIVKSYVLVQKEGNTLFVEQRKKVRLKNGFTTRGVA